MSTQTWHDTPTPNQSSRNGTPITLVVVHCTQGSTAAGAASWLRRPATRASAHVVIDDVEAYRLVPDSRKAWHVKGANARSLGLEIVGFAQWTRAQWLSHMATLKGAAQVQATWHRDHGIPVVESTHRGYHSHAGMPGNDHFNPGPNFPWDVYLPLVKSSLGKGQQEVSRVYPDGQTLRVVIPSNPKSPWAGTKDDWGDALHVLRAIARRGIRPDTKVALAWRGNVFRYDPATDPITARNRIILVARTLLNRYDGGWKK